MQEIREQRILPSDLMVMARQNFPDLYIRIKYEANALVLAVDEKRYSRGPREAWYDVFSRAGLLLRGDAPRSA